MLTSDGERLTNIVWINAVKDIKARKRMKSHSFLIFWANSFQTWSQDKNSFGVVYCSYVTEIDNNHFHRYIGCNFLMNKPH